MASGTGGICFGTSKNRHGQIACFVVERNPRKMPPLPLLHHPHRHRWQHAQMPGY